MSIQSVKFSRSAYKGQITKIGKCINDLCGASVAGEVNRKEVRRLCDNLRQAHERFDELQLTLIGECNNKEEEDKLLLELQDVEHKVDNLFKIATYFIDEDQPVAVQDVSIDEQSDSNQGSTRSESPESMHTVASLRQTQSLQGNVFSRFFGFNATTADQQKQAKSPSHKQDNHLNKQHTNEFEKPFAKSASHLKLNSDNFTRKSNLQFPTATTNKNHTSNDFNQDFNTQANEDSAQPHNYQSSSANNTGISPEQLTHILQGVLSSINVDRTPVTFMHQTQTLKFSGKPADWPSFRDLFSSLASKCRTDADRLLQLKLACQGSDAERIINYYETTNENFIQAWNALETEYSIGKQVITSHMRTVLDQQAMTDESADQLRKIYITTDNSLRALRAINYNARDLWLITILLEKLDSNTTRAWALHSSGIQIPTIDQFLNFLNQRCIALQTCKTSITKPRIKSHHGNSSATKLRYNKKQTAQCLKCKKEHWINNCPEFAALNISDRWKYAKENSLCYNCLQRRHPKDPKSGKEECTSKYNCRHSNCNERHHTLLHQSSVSSHVASNCSEITSGLLATSVVYVLDRNNSSIPCRVLLDIGSSSSFISEQLIQTLKLSRKKADVSVEGVGDIHTCTTRGMTTVEIHSVNCPDFSFKVTAGILKRVTGVVPHDEINITQWPHLSGLSPLADPLYYKPAKVDMIIGVQHFVKLLLPGQIQGPRGTPDAMNSVLGWLILGDVGNQGIINANLSTLRCHHADLQSTEQLIRQFWELEELPRQQLLTTEEINCEEHFITNHIRLPSGRIQVRLPFCEQSLELGDSYQSSLAQALAEEKRFNKNPDYKEKFIEFMNDIEDRGHWKEVPPNEVQKPSNEHYYLKRHGVIKESSSTTKLRVVVNGSSKTSNGVSLNDCLMNGPKVQNDLLPIFLTFRTYKYAFTTDIQKMYRMVALDDRDADFQRILWRKNPSEEFKHYKLTTVIYGTKSAAFLATRTLKLIATENQESYPNVSRAINENTYVDDIMSGTNDVNTCQQLINDLKIVMNEYGFQLHKFIANNPKILKSIPESEREQGCFELNHEDIVKVLGVCWNPDKDQFVFKINPQHTQVITRRTLASEAARLFDPIGWLQPSIILAKILFQETWILGLDWDDPLPKDLSDRWITLRNELPLFELVKIDRWLPNENNKIQLLGFCDASEKAYCAVVYARCQLNNGTIVTNLIASKTRVAPVKSVSIPRLELCAALLLANLIQQLLSAFNHLICEIYAWSDSTDVLSWLSDHPRRWTTFVANRTSQIIDIIPRNQWNHIRSSDNPADIGSRGLLPSNLVNNQLWWNGPEFMKQSREHWPIQTIIKIPSDITESRKSKVSTFIVKPTINCILEMCKRKSSYQRMVNITAIILRQIYNFKQRNQANFDRQDMSSEEIVDAEKLLIRSLQQSTFHQELFALRNSNPLPVGSSLQKLFPFIDSDGLLRVGGRIEEADINFDMKHPIILPGNHHITLCLGRQHHLSNLHAGNTLLSNLLKYKYWIIGQRNLVKKVIYNCLACRRIKAKISSQLMGSLPKARINQNPSFQHVGIDYAGPIMVKVRRLRNVIEVKTWISLFICMVTKAIHLEVVEDMSTESFLAALTSFTSIRGLPSDIYSDCGTNFIGANREMEKIVNESIKSTAGKEFLNINHIKWHFNVPASPNFGGYWEVNVKSVKTHLKSVTQGHLLTLRELITLMNNISACLNSRPICRQSEDPDDVNPLTPAHFLIGRPMLMPPQRDLSLLKINRLKSWQVVQRMQSDFWKRWSVEYLTSLQSRQKWKTEEPNLRINDVVLLVDENTSPTVWPMGIITEVFPDKHNRVRVVKIRTIKGEYERSVSKIVKLPISEDLN